MNRVNFEFFVRLGPLLALLVVAGWHLRGWWEGRKRADRIVGHIQELHPVPWDDDDVF